MKNKLILCVAVLAATLPLTGSALLVSLSYSNNTTDNDSVSSGDALSGSSTIGATSSELTSAGTSTSAMGARFYGANSGRGVSNLTQQPRSISQSINVTVTWTIIAEDWEEYSFSLTPEFHAYLNILDDAADESGDSVSFTSLNGSLKQNGGTISDSLNLSGGSRGTAGSSTLNDTASQTLTGLTGNNTISLQYTGTATATWKIAGARNNRTADAVLWGVDGTMNGDVEFSDSFDNYSSSSARNADGIFVDGTVTLDAIPEPASVAMLGVASALGLFIRRRFVF